MPAFRRVESRQAGTCALGILIPPGPRAAIVVRPRAIPWDLRPATWNGVGSAAPTLCDFARAEAPGVARRFLAGLEWAVRAGRDPLEICQNEAGTAFQVWIKSADLIWIAGRREEGQPFRPEVFATEAEAVALGQLLLPFLWPAGDAEQEYYFNTQLFSQ